MSEASELGLHLLPADSPRRGDEISAVVSW